MNVYDFDHTVYRGDCTLDFWKYCVRKHPAVLRALPKALVSAAKFLLKKGSRESFKESFYGFLRYVHNIETEIQCFWDQNSTKIEPWYLRQKRENDLIISASPDFLIAEICARLHISWIASLVDMKTGKLLGPNCRGAEKVRRFKQKYPQEEIELFYSDSKTDVPLAVLAEKAFIVDRGKVLSWQIDPNDESTQFGLKEKR